MKKHVLPKQRSMLPSAFIVRALTRGGHAYACSNCGERMFVRFESGLCPHCYNGRRPWRPGDAHPEASAHLVLAALTDTVELDELGHPHAVGVQRDVELEDAPVAPGLHDV